ncbi:uncharacterized protein FSUBG_4100 [Fusarium subglutinans]|uniref:Uncharacterized protein n=1 Tax=Gibberella subglutinans TaxID=42677 RepID=A0A8H5Q795_GIBSU|nr:uncharacterized protein FSUBG_4100 [Fusarium subglutinans]KAF5609307.1 hypothetical protein FSUBG_4100 [Fusarium subglutinans]
MSNGFLDYLVPCVRGGHAAPVRKANNIIFGTPANNTNTYSSEALYYQKAPNDVCSGVLYCSMDTKNGLSFATAKLDWYRKDTDPRFYNDFRPMSFGVSSLTPMYSPLG